MLKSPKMIKGLFVSLLSIFILFKITMLRSENPSETHKYTDMNRTSILRMTTILAAKRGLHVNVFLINCIWSFETGLLFTFDLTAMPSPPWDFTSIFSASAYESEKPFFLKAFSICKESYLCISFNDSACMLRGKEKI